ncbi:MAG TPA: hypothetical protein VKG79_11715, partial [Bryobacteraceae bacterium]|nr:hypothetical protein [Bryobacteraceae bacterium]
ILVLVEDAELDRLSGALIELNAEQIAVPAFSAENLRRGHAVHFRCRRDDVNGLRIDVMSSLRGLPGFEDLWERRTSFEIAGENIDVLSVADLVQAKKTQRDKDWPMIRRLVEQSYFSAGSEPRKELVEFWLRELRTPELLMEVCKRFPGVPGVTRPAVAASLAGDFQEVAKRLDDEERVERRLDQEYWLPLKRELEELRMSRRGGV